MKLPDGFADNMKRLMNSADFEMFIHSLEREKHSGLRVNTLKVEVLEFLKLAPFELEPIPWCAEGFYYNEKNLSPGRHPYYHAGLYYVQEPSAMLPAKVLDAKPGERILDLCAAPGGKTVQIASSMKGRGLLVSNDNSGKRVKALVKNIELSGIRNSVVTEEDYRTLSKKFANYFDRILVDAPCSGEGMFRKNTSAARNWDIYRSGNCSLLQYDMLLHADAMLKPGGYLVYSTCTFSPIENECVIAKFLKNSDDYTVVDILKTNGIEPGRPEWCEMALEPEKLESLRKTARLWPHRVRGEGHYVALLHKRDAASRPGMAAAHVGMAVAQGLEAIPKPPEYAEFERENLNICLEGIFVKAGYGVYHVPEGLPDMQGINVVKTGLYLGQIKSGRFSPSHSLVMSLKKEQLVNIIDFPCGSDEIHRYLKGETLILGNGDGLLAVCVDGFPLGWAKGSGPVIKNLYPAGWRMLS
jgi:NOL1/NOP2/sun family putative RNA methylase